MLLDPVKQGQLILCQLRQNIGLIVAITELRFHILHYIRNTGIARMLIERLEQIKF